MAESSDKKTRPTLYLAEFEKPDDIVHAAEQVRDKGYKNWDDLRGKTIWNGPPRGAALTNALR